MAGNDVVLAGVIRHVYPPNLIAQPLPFGKKNMRKAALILLTLALASCGTVAGVGEDITGASRTVQGWF